MRDGAQQRVGSLKPASCQHKNASWRMGCFRHDVEMEIGALQAQEMERGHGATGGHACSSSTPLQQAQVLGQSRSIPRLVLKSLVDQSPFGVQSKWGCNMALPQCQSSCGQSCLTSGLDLRCSKTLSMLLSWSGSIQQHL